MKHKLGLITGYPGWLTSRFLARLQQPSAEEWQEELRAYQWRVVTAPGVRTDGARLSPGIAEVQSADVRDEEGMQEAVRDVDLVLHAAGIIHPRRIPELYAVNRDGTANLARAAVAAGVRRFVHVSSNAAAGFAVDAATPMCEEDPPAPESEYGRSKLQSEQALWEAVSPGRTEGVVLRPTTFYGPHFPARHLQAYLMARSGRPLLIGDGSNSVSMVYIDNLIDCIGRTLTCTGAAGQTYFAADARPYLWREVFEAMGAAMGTEVRPRCLPGFIAPVCNLGDRLLNRLDRYSLYLHVAGEATRHMACRIDKARTELGYRPGVDLKRGMEQAVAWARREGWL